MPYSVYSQHFCQGKTDLGVTIGTGNKKVIKEIQKQQKDMNRLPFFKKYDILRIITKI